MNILRPFKSTRNTFLSKFQHYKTIRSITALDYNKNFEDYQLQIQEEAIKFANEKLAPFSAEWDAKSHFPVDCLEGVGRYGLCRNIYIGSWRRNRIGQIRSICDIRSTC